MVPKKLLGPEQAKIFRITHKANIPLLARNGLVASNFATDPEAYTTIGLSRLTEDRRHWSLPGTPRRRLGDYIPFYFTPNTPMLLNVLTGKGEVGQQPKSEIAILVGNLRAIAAAGYEIAFTDRHAHAKYAEVSRDLADLATLVDWDILRENDYRRWVIGEDKFERYRAEALVYQQLPFNMLEGIATRTREAQTEVEAMLEAFGQAPRVKATPEWFPR